MDDGCHGNRDPRGPHLGVAPGQEFCNSGAVSKIFGLSGWGPAPSCPQDSGVPVSPPCSPRLSLPVEKGSWRVPQGTWLCPASVGGEGNDQRCPALGGGAGCCFLEPHPLSPWRHRQVTSLSASSQEGGFFLSGCWDPGPRPREWLGDPRKGPHPLLGGQRRALGPEP